jgi:cytochrome bd-type quinol oxidase subunit 2
MNKIKLAVLSIVTLALSGMTLLAPVTAHADIAGSLKCGAFFLTDPACADPAGTTDPNTKVNGTITLIINMFSIIVGIIAVIMIVLGGLKYITSSGDANKITSAKNTILYAIVGLVVVALAQFIVRFVLGKVNA